MKREELAGVGCPTVTRYMVYSHVVSFSYEALELYFQVRTFLSVWTSCKYRETWGRELSSSASNYRNLEKHTNGQSSQSAVSGL